jgi:hypothetical protein
MAHDPQLSLTDVQWVLGHAHLTTTQLYVESRELHQTGDGDTDLRQLAV